MKRIEHDHDHVPYRIRNRTGLVVDMFLVGHPTEGITLAPDESVAWSLKLPPPPAATGTTATPMPGVAAGNAATRLSEWATLNDTVRATRAGAPVRRRRDGALTTSVSPFLSRSVVRCTPRQSDPYSIAWRFHRAVAVLRREPGGPAVYLPVVSLPLSSEGRHLARLMAWQPHHGDPTQPEAVAQQISAALQEGRDRYCTSKRTPRPSRALSRRTEVSTPGLDVVEPLYLPPLPSGTETVLVVHVRWCDGVKEVHLESPTVIHNGLHHTPLQLMVTGPDGHQWEHCIPPRHQWAVPVEAAPGASLRLAPAGMAAQCCHSGGRAASSRLTALVECARIVSVGNMSRAPVVAEPGVVPLGRAPVPPPADDVPAGAPGGVGPGPADAAGHAQGRRGSGAPGQPGRHDAARRRSGGRGCGGARGGGGLRRPVYRPNWRGPVDRLVCAPAAYPHRHVVPSGGRRGA